MFRWIKNNIFFAEEMTNRQFIKMMIGAVLLAPVVYLFVLGIHAMFFVLAGGI